MKAGKISQKEAEQKMKAAAKKLEFIEAARFRDEMYDLQKILETKSN